MPGTTFLIDVVRVPANDGDPAGYVATNHALVLVVEADTLDTLTERVLEIGPELYDDNFVRKGAGDSEPPTWLFQYRIGNSSGPILE